MDIIYTRDELETLFNDTVYPHILNTTGKIASYYRHKHHEDYQDIQQLISIDVWRVLERLLVISDNTQSFMRILTSAINFSFRTHYGKIKRRIYIPAQSTISLEDFELEQPSDVNKMNILLDMNGINRHILTVSDNINRFSGEERKAVDFCLRSLLIGREPGKKIIAAFYNTDNPAFFVQYAKYLIRLSIQNIRQSMEHH